MAGVKLVRANIRIRAHYPEAFADFNAPKAAELNDPKFGFNIACTMSDDFNINQTASETDDTMTPCDESANETPLNENYEVSFDVFRDRVLTAVGSYNTSFNLFKAAGCPFVISKGLGKPQDALYVVGDPVNLYGVVTLNPEDIMDDKSMLMLGARFRTTGDLLIEHEVLS